MRPSRVSRRTVIIVVALAALAGGCRGERPPQDPGLVLEPRYEQVPVDLCDRAEVETVADQFGLVMSPWYERISNYATSSTHSYERCRFDAIADDGRFAIQLADFGPSGSVEVRVYHRVADAEHEYDSYQRGSYAYPADNWTGAAMADAAGWWDSGTLLELSRVVEPGYYRGDDEVSTIAVSYLIRQSNLVVEGYLRATSPADETADALAFLHKLQKALIDEVVAHLPVAAGDAATPPP